jgi:hypothetical protein
MGDQATKLSNGGLINFQKTFVLGQIALLMSRIQYSPAGRWPIICYAALT